MKHLKKFLCLMLALVLVLGMSVTALAAEENNNTYTISVPDGDTHTYVVYQIFTGDYDSETKTLSNIRWGENGSEYKSDATEQALVNQTILKELEDIAGKSDKEILDVIEKYWNKSSAIYKGQEVTKDNSLSVPAGYYLIKDKDGSVGKDDAYTTYIVQVANDVKITRKAGSPEVDKEVADDTAQNGWSEAADYAIGESFKFKLTATVPNDKDLASYDTYKLVFHDAMSDGITFEKIDSVKVGDTNVSDYTCTATLGQEGGEWTLTIEDLKQVEGVSLGNTEIIVEVIYSAYLNANAVVNSNGETNASVNNNKVELEYSNNPNVEGTGRTKPDTVFVFTYESDHTKIDGATTAPLEGVTFKLYTDKDCTVEVSLIYDGAKGAYRPVLPNETPAEAMASAADGKFNIVGLDAGTYYLKEIQELSGYNKLDGPIEITITAERSENASETGADLKLTTTKTEGKDSLEIENFQGSVLPSTGGIGTTIFYVLGGILVLGCGVILVTRKRMSKEE